jgi:hypothetical protein
MAAANADSSHFAECDFLLACHIASVLLTQRRSASKTQPNAEAAAIIAVARKCVVPGRFVIVIAAVAVTVVSVDHIEDRRCACSVQIDYRPHEPVRCWRLPVFLLLWDSEAPQKQRRPRAERIVFMPNFLEHFRAERSAEFTYFPIASMSTAPRQPENSPEVTNTLFEPATMAEVPLGTMQAIKPTIRAGFFLPTPALTSSVPCCNE